MSDRIKELILYREFEEGRILTDISQLMKLFGKWKEHRRNAKSAGDLERKLRRLC